MVAALKGLSSSAAPQPQPQPQPKPQTATPLAPSPPSPCPPWRQGAHQEQAAPAEAPQEQATPATVSESASAPADEANDHAWQQQSLSSLWYDNDSPADEADDHAWQEQESWGSGWYNNDSQADEANDHAWEQQESWSSGWYNDSGKQSCQSYGTSYWRSGTQRWGKRGGKNAAYFTARAHARNMGKEYLRWWDSQNPKEFP